MPGVLQPVPAQYSRVGQSEFARHELEPSGGGTGTSGGGMGTSGGGTGTSGGGTGTSDAPSMRTSGRPPSGPTVAEHAAAKTTDESDIRTRVRMGASDRGWKQAVGQPRVMRRAANPHRNPSCVTRGGPRRVPHRVMPAARTSRGAKRPRARDPYRAGGSAATTAAGAIGPVPGVAVRATTADVNPAAAPTAPRSIGEPTAIAVRALRFSFVRLRNDRGSGRARDDRADGTKGRAPIDRAVGRDVGVGEREKFF